MVSGATKRPSPRKTSTPLFLAASKLSTLLIPARRRRIRRMAKPKSPSASAATAGPPKRSAAVRASSQARDARMIPFDGTQPTFRQSPPIRWRSISATRAPRPAAPLADTSPAVPAPITTR